MQQKLRLLEHSSSTSPQKTNVKISGKEIIVSSPQQAAESVSETRLLLEVVYGIVTVVVVVHVIAIVYVVYRVYNQSIRKEKLP